MFSIPSARSISRASPKTPGFGILDFSYLGPETTLKISSKKTGYQTARFSDNKPLIYPRSNSAAR